jgi:hypothetical protein
MAGISSTHRRLSDDHDAVGEVLKQLLTALGNKDAETSYAKLDLLWGRLAVHIRAEHLHLFPAVTTRSSQAQAVVENLRADHDFFMRELARAIAVFREGSLEADFAAVRAAVREIEKRLAHHNEIEENQAYHWAGTILTESEQLDLTARINAELENRPPRFSEEAWANLL